MTNNDFDFIKQKFDESGVNAPEQLNEEFVKEKIQHVEPLKEKKSGKVIIRLSIAAVIAVVLVNAIIITGLVGIINKAPSIIAGMNASKQLASVSPAELRTFKNEDEIKAELQKIFDDRENELKKIDNNTFLGDIAEYAQDNGGVAKSDSAANGTTGSSANEFSAGSSGGMSHNSTYIQTTGVDEADYIKTDDGYIYFLNQIKNCIEVYRADNGVTELTFTINAPETTDPYDTFFSNFYICGDRLVAIADSTADYHMITRVCLYDISDRKNIKLKDSFIQSGRYCSSRMIGDMLYAVSTYYAYDSDCMPYCGGGTKATGDEAEKRPLPADCVYSVEKPADSNFLVVSAIDTGKSAQAVKTKAILGSAQDIYCSQENLYVMSEESYVYDESNSIVDNLREIREIFGREILDGEILDGYDYDNNVYYEKTYTQIVKINLTGDIGFSATARVEGRIDDQYSLDESKGTLRVATTSRDSESGNEINNLFVLDGSLKELGKVTGFAENESIKAVRYIGDTAYVITYEQTDPLFVIDLSDPSKPTITGEVKISGFSTMLVPVDDNTLLGIGYHTYDPELDGDEGMEIQDGLKLVTFDVSNKSAPKIIDTKIYENHESIVQYDPKALLVNFERGDYAIPLNYRDTHWLENEYYNEHINVTAHSGVLNFRIDNGKIIITDNYVSDKFGRDENNDQVERCVYIGDYIYMIGTHYEYDTSIDYSEYDGSYAEPEIIKTIIDSVKYK